jgi:hypothetical protein
VVDQSLYSEEIQGSTTKKTPVLAVMAVGFYLGLPHGGHAQTRAIGFPCLESSASTTDLRGGVDPADSNLVNLLAEIDQTRVQPATEHTPSQAAIERAKALISEAADRMTYIFPEGEVDSYYGELGVEWRNADKLIRLTCFGNADRPARLDFGTMSKTTPGEYGSEPNVDAASLAARLDWLSEDDSADDETSA